MRAAIFAVTLDAKNWVKASENPLLGSVQKSNKYKGRIVRDNPILVFIGFSNGTADRVFRMPAPTATGA
jgi:hypothetical protein